VVRADPVSVYVSVSETPEAHSGTETDTDRTRKLVITPRCSIHHRDDLAEFVGLWIPEVEGTVFASKKSPSR